MKANSTALLIVGIMVLGVASIGISLTGCSTPGDDRYSNSTKAEPRISEKKFKFNGMVFHHADGDYYTIQSEAGNVYYPLNLEAPYRQDRLRIQVSGESRGYTPDGTARMFYIYDISTVK